MSSEPSNAEFPNVVTLVGKGLAGSHVNLAKEALSRGDASQGPEDWLAAGLACDLPFAGLEPSVAEERVRDSLAGLAIDIAAQPKQGRRKRLLVADMESTVIRNEMLDELAEFVGKRTEVEDITARAMAGELDFAGSVRARVGLLAGLTSEVLEAAQERIEIDPGTAALVATMRSSGAFTALVSGGFGAFAGPVQKRLGFDVYHANELRLLNGRLTGEVVEPILGRAAKLDTLELLCQEQGLEPADVAAVGDGANDLAMLGAAGLGVAFHAKPAVIAAARFSVRHGDLRTLLFFQGYRDSELVG